jgi:hypothetical protein
MPGARAAIGSAPDQVQANVPANPGAAALADALAACDATTRRPTLAPA